MNKTELIFVFGSNYDGIHGAGAAHTAFQQWGAVWGRQGAIGRTGNSYAIPTKASPRETLPLDSLKWYVDVFAQHTQRYQYLNRRYIVTRIGCGLAGYTDKEIAPLFINCGPNCIFDSVWKPWLGVTRSYFTFNERTGEMKLPCVPTYRNQSSAVPAASSN